MPCRSKVKMKKILGLVSYTFLPAQTGGQKAIASLYQNLSKQFSVVCIGTVKNDSAKAEGYTMLNILSVSPLRYVNPFNFFIIRNIIKNEKPDYLQLEHPYLGWLAILLKKATGIKLIVRSHNIEGIRFKNLGKWWWKLLLTYEKWVLRQADFNFFISDVDRVYAIRNFGLQASACATITYGVNFTKPPSFEQHKAAKAFLTDKHKLDKNDIIILFNGAFDYPPNVNALNKLINQIFPLLKTLAEKSFKLIVCGKDIPENLIENNADNNVIFAGYVADINTYLCGSSIFVNPITEGGGIKTKLVEALTFNLNCVSFKTGAIGVPPEICGEKLVIVDDNNYSSFATSIIAVSNITSNIPANFYVYFSNDNILHAINNILTKDKKN